MPEILEVPQQAPTASSDAPPALPVSVGQALERLLLANQIRELADYPTPVTVRHISRTDGWLARWVRRMYGAAGTGGPAAKERSPLGWMALDVCVLVCLRAWLSGGKIWRIARTTLGAIVHNAIAHRRRYYAQPPSQITGYVNVSDQETPLIRLCLLLRLLKRYGACVEFLLQRLRVGRPAQRTRRWLAFFLREAGEIHAAEQLTPPAGAPTARDALSSSATPQSPRFTSGVLIVTMFDSPVFRRSLLSLMESDFQGQIVVVEDGYQPQCECEAFCRQLGVTYVKNPEWTGCSAGVNLGMEAMKSDTDIITYAQNDILWPPQWHASLDRAWQAMEPSGKAGLINLGYVQVNPGADAVFRELFLNGDYEDWLWTYRMAREVHPNPDSFRDLQNHDQSRLFGLGRDAWGDRPSECKIMTGKFSVAGSFRMDTWRALGGFSSELPFGNDIELQYHSCLNRTWNLWINNRPLIHLASSDTSRLTRPGDHARHQRLCRQTYEGFARKYGWEVDHFFWTWYAETCVIYHDEIVNAVNALRFEEIDFVFDDLFERLKRKRLSSCELMACLSRPRCRYV